MPRPMGHGLPATKGCCRVLAVEKKRSWRSRQRCRAAAESLRFDPLASAARLVVTLWSREQRHERIHAKLKAVLEAMWEHYGRSLANNVDYSKKEPIVRRMLMLLVEVYQDDEEWAAAGALLDALRLAPELKDSDSREFHKRCEARRFNLSEAELQWREALQLSHSRNYLQAARVFKDMVISASKDIDDEDIDDATGTVATHDAALLLFSAGHYMRANQYQSAATTLDRVERKLQATTSWPPPGPRIADVDPKQAVEFDLCETRARLARETGRYDQAVVELQKAASLKEAIINDLQQRQLPVAKHLRTLALVLTLEADIQYTLNKADVKGLEARIERIQTLDPDALTVCELRVHLLLAKGNWEEAAELMRELFLLYAERQESSGGYDDSWIIGYNQGCAMSLAGLVDLLQWSHILFGRNDKALLWAERGKMRLFMHRVHAQQHQEDDPESAMDSMPNDFDRDDGKALDMLFNMPLACGPNVALLEYSYLRATHAQELRLYVLGDLKLDNVAGFESPKSSVWNKAWSSVWNKVWSSVWNKASASSPTMRIGCRTLDCPDIEQLVTKARDSIIARPQKQRQRLVST